MVHPSYILRYPRIIRPISFLFYFNYTLSLRIITEYDDSFCKIRFLKIFFHKLESFLLFFSWFYLCELYVKILWSYYYSIRNLKISIFGNSIWLIFHVTRLMFVWTYKDFCLPLTEFQWCRNCWFVRIVLNCPII